MLSVVFNTVLPIMDAVDAFIQEIQAGPISDPMSMNDRRQRPSQTRQPLSYSEPQESRQAQHMRFTQTPLQSQQPAYGQQNRSYFQPQMYDPTEIPLDAFGWSTIFSASPIVADRYTDQELLLQPSIDRRQQAVNGTARISLRSESSRLAPDRYMSNMSAADSSDPSNVRGKDRMSCIQHCL